MRTFLMWIAIVALGAPVLWAGDTVTLKNELGGDLRAVYGHAPGHEPWLLAGPVAAGEAVEIDRDKLRVCGRLIVDSGADDSEENSVFQFFTLYYLVDAEELLLTTRKFSDKDDDFFPLLVATMDGERRGTPAGLTFSILTGHMEQGMTRQRWAEFMNPLHKNTPENPYCAVNLALASWDIQPPGPVFSDGGDEAVVTELTLTSYLVGRMLSEYLSEFASGDVVPWYFIINSDNAAAFSEEALAEAPGATLVEAEADAGLERRRDIFIERFNEAWRETLGNNDDEVVIVMASAGMRYELRLDFVGREMTLQIKRR